MEGAGGVFVYFNCDDEKLFLQCTRNVQVRLLTECLFADDDALPVDSSAGV